MGEGLKLRTLGGAEWDERAGVTMHDRDHVRPQLVDLAVDIALAHLRHVDMRERVTVHVEGDDVSRRDHAGRDVARHQVSALGFALVADADVPERIDDVEAEQDLVGEHEIVELKLGRAGELGGFGRSSLGASSLSSFGIHSH